MLINSTHRHVQVHTTIVSKSNILHVYIRTVIQKSIIELVVVGLPIVQPTIIASDSATVVRSTVVIESIVVVRSVVIVRVVIRSTLVVRVKVVVFLNTRIPGCAPYCIQKVLGMVDIWLGGHKLRVERWDPSPYRIKIVVEGIFCKNLSWKECD